MVKHKPTATYLKGEMPTYDIPTLIEHIEYRILIHETHMGLVIDEDNPNGYHALTSGDENFHLWAIEGYYNFIYRILENREA